MRRTQDLAVKYQLSEPDVARWPGAAACCDEPEARGLDRSVQPVRVSCGIGQEIGAVSPYLFASIPVLHSHVPQPRLRMRGILHERHSGHVELRMERVDVEREVAGPTRVDAFDRRPGQ